MKHWILSVGLFLVLGISFAWSEELPQPNEYTTIQNGHLSYQGKRLRIWGSQGNLVAKDYREIDAEVERFAALGFNGHRTLWWDIDIDNYNYTKGDQSLADLQDYLLASLRKHGVWVWADMLNSALIKPEHVDLVDDPATREDWLKSVDAPLKRPLYIVWDARAEAAYINQIKKILNHVNQHTGLRWADDPVFYVWEITNEQWWLQRILNFALHFQLPEFFQKELYQKWNDWLKNKYKDDATLRGAWLGSVLPEESLETSTVQMLPLFCPTGGAAEALGIEAKNFSGMKYTRKDFSQQRGADVVEFLTTLLLEHKKRVYAAIRAEGKPGIGISIVPIVYDTGYSFSPQSIYVNSFGDALCVGTYVSQITLDTKHPRYPFKSLLEESPSLSYGDPWVEQNRLADKPTFIYENMILMPDKYRCEYPYLLTLLAAIQDWDVIDFHYYGHPENDIFTTNEPFNKMLRPDSRFSCQGLQFKWDEVLISSMSVAGEIFKNFELAAPQTPTLMTLGQKSLWNMDMLEWGELAKLFAPTVYRYGLRMKFDPNQTEAIKVEGPVVHGREFLPGRIQPTDQAKLDWHKGILQMDTPKVKVAAGFLPDRVTFNDGVEIQDITVNIPKDMPYYKQDEDRFVCFGLATADGENLASSKRILLSATCGAFNTGMKMNTENWKPGNQFNWMQDYAEWGQMMCDQFGSLPVLVARVGMKVKAPALAGCEYRFRDWHLKTIQTGTIGEDGLMDIPNTLPVFVVEILRNGK